MFSSSLLEWVDGCGKEEILVFNLKNKTKQTLRQIPVYYMHNVVVPSNQINL